MAKNIVMTGMAYHEMKSRDSVMKKLARLKAKIDNPFEAKLYQNQNEKPMFESDSSTNGTSKSMITPIKRRARFYMH